MDAIATKADGKNKAGKEAAKGAPTKVVPGAGKELPRLERGAERTDTVAAARVGSASQTEGPLWWPAVSGDSVDPVDLGNMHGTAPDGRQRRGGRARLSAEGLSLHERSAGQGT